MIEITDIKKKFGSLEVLKGISLDINKGEIISLVGPSGAGKTTFLQIIGTLLNSDSGTVKINGTDLSKLSSSKLAEFRNNNIGFVFQFHHLLPEFTALENVCIPAYIAKRNKSEVIPEAEKLLGILNLLHRKDHKPNELSGGEQQRVAVARALINNPSVILADEPSGNLDMQNKKDLHELFLTLREKFNQTFIIVTHNNELAQMSDRIIKIEDGIIG